MCVSAFEIILIGLKRDTAPFANFEKVAWRRFRGNFTLSLLSFSQKSAHRIRQKNLGQLIRDFFSFKTPTEVQYPVCFI